MTDKAKSNSVSKKRERKPKNMMLLIGIPVLMCICGPYIYYSVLMNAWGRANAPAGYHIPLYSELWKVAAGAAIFYAFRKLFYWAFYPMFYRLAKVRDDEELNVKYARKACDQFSYTCYFIVSAFWGWSVLKDTDVLPWYLGGMKNGEYENIRMDTIFVNYDSAILQYSLFTFGYHVMGFIDHVFLEERMNDFEEMLLHHIAAVCLYFAFIYGNVVPLGAVIAYLHDLADIFGSMCKGLNATIYQDSSAVIFIICMIVWFVTRIVSLPSIIYSVFTKFEF